MLCVISSRIILGCGSNVRIGESGPRASTTAACLPELTSEYKAFTKPELTRHTKTSHGAIGNAMDTAYQQMFGDQSNDTAPVNSVSG
jgi:hypothetical protein